MNPDYDPSLFAIGMSGGALLFLIFATLTIANWSHVKDYWTDFFQAVNDVQRPLP